MREAAVWIMLVGLVGGLAGAAVVGLQHATGKLRRPEPSRDWDALGIRYWPACPDCGGPVGPARRRAGGPDPLGYVMFRCNEHDHWSRFTIGELVAMQDRRRIEVGGA